VTIALARMAKGAANPVGLAGAASLAAMVSLLRVLLVTAIVQASVLPYLVLPILAAALVFAAAGLLLLWRGGRHGAFEHGGGPRNPFELMPLLAFAFVFAVVATASAVVARHWGTGGIVATAAFSGAFDVDVAALSALRLVKQAVVDPALAGQAVLAAIATNAVLRPVLAALAGPVRFSAVLAGITALALCAGLLVYVLDLA
jgi:uncharacterized membrane protein (DUF4010 family)